MIIGETLGWVAAVLSATLALPQMFRIFRTRSVAGLSVLAWQTLVLAGVGWTIHGLESGRLQVILPNVILGTAAIVVLSQIQRSRHLGVIATWALPAGVVIAATAADVLLGPVAYAVIMFIPAAIGQFAQVREIRQASDVSGVSLPTLLINLGAQFAWLGYALPTNEVAIIWVAAPLAVLMSLVVVALLVRRRQLAESRSLAA